MLNYFWSFNNVKAFCNKGFEDVKTFLDACKILKVTALLGLRVYFLLILEDFICSILIINIFNALLSQRSTIVSALALALQINKMS